MFEKWIGVILFLFMVTGLLEAKNGYASIPLPKPSSDGMVSVEKAIKQKRTIRDFQERTLSLNHLAQLL